MRDRHGRTDPVRRFSLLTLTLAHGGDDPHDPSGWVGGSEIEVLLFFFRFGFHPLPGWGGVELEPRHTEISHVCNVGQSFLLVAW